MNRQFRLAALSATWLLAAGCATTGDPREGGLFGWSETKAQARQREREQRAEAAQAALDREIRRGGELQDSEAAAEHQTTRAQQQHAEVKKNSAPCKTYS